MARRQNTTTDDETPANAADDTELYGVDLSRIEHRLKKSLARRMGAIQEDRAFAASGRNVGNAADYVGEARTLRKILKMQRRPGYVRLSGMLGGSEWVNDELSEEISNAATVAETCEAIHEAGDAEERGTMTDHQTVPGRPSPGHDDEDDEEPTLATDGGEPTITEEEAAEGARHALKRLAEAEPVTDTAEDADALTADGGTLGAEEWGPEDVTPGDVLADPHGDRTLTVQTVDLKERSYGDDRLYVDAEKDNGQTVTLRRWHLENAAASMVLKRPETDGGTSWDAGHLAAERAEQRAEQTEQEDREAVEAAMRRLTHAEHRLTDEATDAEVEAAVEAAE